MKENEKMKFNYQTEIIKDKSNKFKLEKDHNPTYNLEIHKNVKKFKLFIKQMQNMIL